MSAPQYPRPDMAAIPATLRALCQWVVWKAAWRPGKGEEPGRWTKMPYDPKSGRPASATDPGAWAGFVQAVETYDAGAGRFAGIGYVFARDDPYIGIDLDGCRDPQTGALTPEAAAWVERLGTYTEVSPSGTGVKIFGLGGLPDGRSGRRNAAAGVEIYDQARYFTVTGQRLPGTPATIEQIPAAALGAFLCQYFPAPASPTRARARGGLSAPTDPPSAADLRDDDALIARALAASNGAKFAALWRGDTAGYPGSSEADAALAALLAYPVGRDPERIERIMRRSGLVRDKWDEKRGEGTTYLRFTIGKAIDTVGGSTSPQKPVGNFSNFSKSCSGGRINARSLKGEEERERVKKPLLEQQFEKFEKIDLGDRALSLPWEEPLPFGQENLPPFPLAALPRPLRAFVQGVATSVGTAADLPGVQCLCALALAVQKRVAIQGKPGHVEPLSLWGVSIAPPGARKSAVMASVRAPIAHFEAAENERRAPEVEESASEERVARSRLAKAENAAARGNPDLAAQAELDSARRALAQLRPVRPLRLLADDATPEALAVLMSENEGRIGVLDAEGAAFGHMCGRYTDRPAIELHLRGHSGEDHVVDRAGKERRTVAVRNAALTLGVAVQPEVLSDLRKRRELVGRGALARCLFSFCEETAAADEYESPPVSEGVLFGYRRLVESLLALGPTAQGDPSGQRLPHLLHPDPEAHALFVSFYRQVQQLRRDEGGGLVAEWLAKLHGATLRLAGVLHLAEHGAEGIALPISRETMGAARELSLYFLAHARAALSRIREDEASEGARAVLDWVQRNRAAASEPAGVSLGELRRQLRRFDTQEDLLAALYVLASRGYAREVAPPEREEGTPGRKPSGRWQFHPSLTWEALV